MAKEIERKFLVKNDDFKNNSVAVLFRQGYLSTDIDRVVRVRIEGNQAKLTIKGRNSGMTRDEFEYEIPVDQAKELLDKLCLKPIIEKYRYKVEVDNLIWEVDQFMGDNEGLIIAEIEVPSEDYRFDIPEWIDKEVTGIERYYNSYISQHPYKNWQKN